MADPLLAALREHARHKDLELTSTWPDGVRLQLHILEGDEDFEFAQTLAATVAASELFVSPGTEHSFAEHDDHAATVLTERVLAFLDQE